jgi:SHS2 domain-containing protein
VDLPRFQILDHTGDLMVRLWGDDPADLLRSAGVALFSVIAGGAPIRPRIARRVAVRGADLEEILVGWMNRLLLLHAVERLLLSRFEPGLPAAGEVRATVRGEVFDASRHVLLREVKGATYHNVRVEPDGARLTARVVLDL